jgi:hypothetical protein
LSGKKKLEKRSPILRLGIQDRIALVQILPRKGTRLTLQVAGDIRKKSVITLEEQKRIKYKEQPIPGTNNFEVVWDAREERVLEVQLSALEVDLLKRSIEVLDQAEEVWPEATPLYDKIKAL